ncbi:MAG TPA: DUF4350 domain-containing protein [Verrucomicrobiae bacterium]|jgi:hypothetical protein
MATQTQPSFSPRRHWRIGFDIFARTLLVLAVVVMANFLGARFFERFYLSSHTSEELSSRTLSVLHSMTNQVAVTLYYDTSDEFYPTIVALLNEYKSATPKISVKVVDYVLDAGEAEKIKEQYKLNAADDKDLIIFDAGNNHVKIIPGDQLVQTTLQQVPNEKEHEFRRKPVAFNGEMTFTSALLALENPHPLKAYFLQGHGEGGLDDSGNFGYLKFATTLAQNYITVTNLELNGDSGVPMDCNLLIIAAPTDALSENELQKIGDYLQQGGRLFVLFNYASVKQPTGLEPILQHWGINVVADILKDPHDTMTGQDLKVRRFAQHPAVNALAQHSLQMILPRPVESVNWQNPPANAPQVTELAFSGPDSTLAGDPAGTPRSYPVIAAVEQKPVAGAATLRGNTRIIVAGDSIFLGNYYIEGGANRDFVSYAVNWLLDRTTLLEGIGPHPVTEFRLLMTHEQQQDVRWLLLGALPGAVLLLGGCVWLARRK